MTDFTKEQMKDLLKCVCLVEIDFGKCQRLDYLKRLLRRKIDGIENPSPKDVTCNGGWI